VPLPSSFISIVFDLTPYAWSRAISRLIRTGIDLSLPRFLELV
jgi:hypothetical protein